MWNFNFPSLPPQEDWAAETKLDFLSLTNVSRLISIPIFPRCIVFDAVDFSYENTFYKESIM